jgi:hypothetical protein
MMFSIWIFHSLDITNAEVHGVYFLKNIKQEMSFFLVLGDREYLSETIQLNLFQTANIQFETPKKKNQKNDKTQLYSF